LAKLCARVVSNFSWLTGCTFKANLSNVTSPPRSSSSSSSAPISEHSRLHKLTPLWTTLRTHPRCVETKVMGPKVDASSIVPHGAMSTLVDLPGVANPLEDDWWLLEECASGLGSRKMSEQTKSSLCDNWGDWGWSVLYIRLTAKLQLSCVNA